MARRELACELVCLGDRNLLAERARRLGLTVELRDYNGTARRHEPGTLTVEHHPLAAASIAGRLDTANARSVLELLDRATDGAMAGEFSAIVTAPVHKGVIADSGVPFTGHTEYLAERTHVRLPVMMLASQAMRVALATTHLPLRDVSAAITIESLTDVVMILHHDLVKWWGI
jgi:4-hydroxythreonine-4-phosphate dehydrogenase